MTIQKDIVQKTLSDLEEQYVAFMVSHFEAWRAWADAAQRMADGEAVKPEEVPEVFAHEYEFTRVLLEMDHQKSFNWSDPRIRAFFAGVAQSPFYTFWGTMICEVAMRLSALFGVKTLLEIGAGSGNLTATMLAKLASSTTNLPLVITDAHPVVLENMSKLREQYPAIPCSTLLWDITAPPPAELHAVLTPPVLLYERATITYANWRSIENFSAFADVLVLGDYFNYTGELFAYDFIFEKIGAKPLLYRDVKTVLDACFTHHYILDAGVYEKIGLPNITLTIAWK